MKKKIDFNLGKKTLKFQGKPKVETVRKIKEDDVWVYINALSERKLDKFVTKVNECKLISLSNIQRKPEKQK